MPDPSLSTNIATYYYNLVTGKCLGRLLSPNEAVRIACHQIAEDAHDGRLNQSNAEAFLDLVQFYASGSISGTSNASPDVITTAAAHGLQPGDAIKISGVVGDAGLNFAEWLVGTTPSTTTFTVIYAANGLPYSGTGAYVSGGAFIRDAFNRTAQAAVLDVLNYQNAPNK